MMSVWRPCTAGVIISIGLACAAGVGAILGLLLRRFILEDERGSEVARSARAFSAFMVATGGGLDPFSGTANDTDTQSPLFDFHSVVVFLAVLACS